MLVTLHPSGFYVASTAVVAGDVTVGRDSSFWFSSVARGDVAPIVIGQRVNVQDAAVIHCESGVPNVIEDDVTIGHGALVHGSFVGAWSLIGIGATVLSRTRIGRECVIAAGAVVPPGMEIPDRSVVMGVPGKIVRAVTEKDMEYARHAVNTYLRLARRYAAGELKAL